MLRRVGREEELTRLLAWAAAAGATVSVVGSGSNLLIADEGVAGLVVKLDRALAQIEVEQARILCGGGARLPAVAAAAARAGLSGIEFGVNIPGTVGGAVRMNANAYGGELARVLEWVQVATAAGSEQSGCSGLAIGGARFSPKHANFIENTGDASTADVVAVMAAGRHRVKERFGVELEPEVQTLGDVRFPWR